MKVKDTEFIPCSFGNKNMYKKMIKKILKYTDEVVFTIAPFLISDDEFRNSRWSELSDSFLYSVYDIAPSDLPCRKSKLIVLKNDYYVYDYFLNLSSLYEIQEDDELGVTMEDPAFMKQGEIFCYAVSHEEMCVVEKELWEKIRK